MGQYGDRLVIYVNFQSRRAIIVLPIKQTLGVDPMPPQKSVTLKLGPKAKMVTVA